MSIISKARPDYIEQSEDHKKTRWLDRRCEQKRTRNACPVCTVAVSSTWISVQPLTTACHNACLPSTAEEMNIC